MESTEEGDEEVPGCEGIPSPWTPSSSTTKRGGVVLPGEDVGGPVRPGVGSTDREGQDGPPMSPRGTHSLSSGCRRTSKLPVVSGLTSRSRSSVGPPGEVPLDSVGSFLSRRLPVRTTRTPSQREKGLSPEGGEEWEWKGGNRRPEGRLLLLLEAQDGKDLEKNLLAKKERGTPGGGRSDSEWRERFSERSGDHDGSDR